MEQIASGFECKTRGTISSHQLAALSSTLLELSFTEQPIKTYELVQESPGPPAVLVRLRRSLMEQDMEREGADGPLWKVWSETVVSDKNVTDPTICIRSITEGESQGHDVPRLWGTLPLYQVHEVVREGSSFEVRTRAGPMVEVTVCTLYKINERGNLDTAVVVSPQHRIVEVTCRVTDGEQQLGVAAIGQVQGTLKPYLKFQWD